jgi:hypothetical protein
VELHLNHFNNLISSSATSIYCSYVEYCSQQVNYSILSTKKLIENYRRIYFIDKAWYWVELHLNHLKNLIASSATSISYSYVELCLQQVKYSILSTKKLIKNYRSIHFIYKGFSWSKLYLNCLKNFIASSMTSISCSYAELWLYQDDDSNLDVNMYIAEEDIISPEIRCNLFIFIPF